MSNVPGDLRFAETHEWVRATDDETVVVGVSDHAQHALGDLVYVELPEVGATVAQGDAVAVVESVKAASDVYSPVSGEIVSVNESLADSPGNLNTDPYGDGWIMKIRPAEGASLEKLLDAAAYSATLED